MFGEIPAYGFFVRHVKGLEMNNIHVSFMNEDLRSPFVLNDVNGADFHNVKAQVAQGTETRRTGETLMKSARLVLLAAIAVP